MPLSVAELLNSDVSPPNLSFPEMITYVYETVPTGPEEKVERFEWRQRISEPALERHPETDVPVRRVVTGGLGFTATGSEPASGGCCQGSCGC